jgi:membrane protease YdiL (CAAX protease family)
MPPTQASAPRGYGVGIVVVSLLMRLVLFAAFQGLVALILAGVGSTQPWASSAAWWPFTAAATSIVTFGFLRWRARAEGFAWGDFYRPVRPGLGRDILWAVVVAAVGGTLAVAGSILLAPVFFADPLAANILLIQPLPVWAAIVAVVVFPVTVALTELPLYFGFAQPRIAALTGSAWVAVVVPSVFLSLQHATLPLILDPAFIAWRGLMFLGFALVLGWALWKRPRLLPYLIVVHFLLDTQAAISILIASVA